MPRSLVRLFLSIGFLAAIFCVWPAAAFISAGPYAFYDVAPDQLPGPPGSIIRTQAFGGAPWGTRAVRVLYRSTGLGGEPIAVSAVVVMPAKSPPVVGRPIVAWAHPTTGVARKCAPSLLLDQVMATIPGLVALVRQGAIVVATDYPGLGTASIHPYLVGVSEGRAVLDSVRAARTLTDASNRFAVWGYSQGGHAALWTAELTATYAPELELVGVAAAAPASDLAKLFENTLSTTAGQILTALSLWSWSHVYQAPLSSVVVPAALKPVSDIGGACVSGFADLIVDASAYGSIQSGFLKDNPARIPPWESFLSASTPVAAGVKWPPVFIAQGSADTIVDQPVTRDFAIQLCREGVFLRFFAVPGATHEVIADVSAAAAVRWIGDRFAGKLPPTDCIAKGGASH